MIIRTQNNNTDEKHTVTRIISFEVKPDEISNHLRYITKDTVDRHIFTLIYVDESDKIRKMSFSTLSQNVSELYLDDEKYGYEEMEENAAAFEAIIENKKNQQAIEALP